MDTEVVQAFNSEITSLYDMKPPISKAKIVDITKSAMKAIKYYKHVVFIVEKFLQKCKPEYKIPGLYVIDSIIRQSQHQYKEKDVYGPRFSTNIRGTLQILLGCSSSDKLKIVRVLNLWKSGKVFNEELVDALLVICSENGLETDVASVEVKVKGDKANMEIYSSPNRKRRKTEPDSEPRASSSGEDSVKAAPEPESSVPSEIVPENGISERELLDLIRAVNLDLGGAFSSDIKLLKAAHRIVNDKLVKQRELDTNSHGSIQKLLSREFDYSDEDSGDEAPPRPVAKQAAPLSREEVIRIAGRILDHEEVKTEVKKMAERKIQEVNAQFMSPLPPPAAPAEQFISPPPSFGANPPVPPPPMPGFQVPTGAFNMPPPGAPGSSSFSQPPPAYGMFGGSSEYDDRRKRPRAQSPPKRHDDSFHNPQQGKDEAERRLLCLPARTKPGHMLIGSCTIWLGKLPANTGENDIRAALSEFGDPLRINILSTKACAYITMRDRKSAAKIVDRLKNSLQILRKFVKLDWAPGQMVKDCFKHLWDGEFGVAQIPYNEIPADIDSILDGFHVDIDSVPDHLKGRINQQKNEKNSSGEAAVPVAPPVVPPALVPQMLVPPQMAAGGFPTAQFPFPMPPAQGMPFLPPGFPIASLIPPQPVQEGLQGSSHAAPPPTMVPPPPRATPPRHPGNGNANFRSGNANLEPLGTPRSGGFRNQFYGQPQGPPQGMPQGPHQGMPQGPPQPMQQNQRGRFNDMPPTRFPPMDLSRPPPNLMSPEAPRAPPSGDRDRRRSRLFQSEQPRDSSQSGDSSMNHS